MKWLRVVRDAMRQESAKQKAMAKHAPSKAEKEMAERDARIADKIAKRSS